MSIDPGPKKRKPWWFKLLIVAASLLMIVLLLVWSIEVGGRKRLDGVINEARAKGQPVTFDEILARRRAWPADQDAGLYFVTLEPRITQIAKDESLKNVPLLGDPDLPPLGHLWPDDDQNVATATLARLGPDISQINRLRDYPGGSLPLHVADNPINTLLPNLAEIRFCVKLKTLEIMNGVMKGNTDTLVEDLTVQRRLGQLVADHPTLISALVKIACDSLEVDTIERVNALTQLQPGQLRQIDEQLAALEKDDPIPWGLLGERAFLIGAFQYALRTGQRPWMEVPMSPNIAGLRGWMKRDIAVGFEMETRLIDVATQPRQRRDQAKKLDNEIQSLPAYYPVSRIMCPSLDRALELSLRSTANIRAARVGLAVERYRIDKDKFPERLEQLVPEYMKDLPVDPFDDQPLHYKVTSDAAVVYSVGDDGIDSGGDVRSEKARRAPPDCGFTVLKRDHRRMPPAKTESPAPQTAPSISKDPT